MPVALRNKFRLAATRKSAGRAPSTCENVGKRTQELALQLRFLRASESMATMIRRSWTRPASIEETLALWAASLREIKKRIRPLFRQERVARNAGLFLESLLGDEQRKTGWMRAEAAGDPGPWRQQAILGRR